MQTAMSEALSIDKNSAGMRLDIFLTNRFAQTEPDKALSRAEIQRLISKGFIKLNGAIVKRSVRVKVNDRIEVQSLPRPLTSVEAQPLPVEILYEDMDCLVLNKAPGIVVHPAAGQSRDTLVNALLHHCKDLAGVGSERRPGIVHRLDKDTSGVMIVAKNQRSYQHLVAQFKNRSVRKEYLALVHGRLVPAEGRIDRPIGRHRADRKRMSSLYRLNKGRPALTEWQVLEYFATARGAATLVRLLPRTGRTHQLRVHLADKGFPIIGDKVYGRRRHKGARESAAERLSEEFARQALHAEFLAVPHLRTGKMMEFKAPLAKDMEDLLKSLRRAQSDQITRPGERLRSEGVDKVSSLK